MTLETLTTLWLKATPAQRNTIGKSIETALTGKKENTIPRLLSRNEVATLIGRTPQRVDQLCRMGVLQRIYAKGTTRAIGVTEESVRNLTTQRNGEEVAQ